MRLHLAFAAAVAAAGCLASPASAALVARQDGFYYDTVLDITWMVDANYAKTAGRSDTGLMNHQGADALARGYVYHNEAMGIEYDDWRLPTLGPDVGDYDLSPEGGEPRSGGQHPRGFGATGTGWGTPDDSGIHSELGWMFYANLGGRAPCEAVGSEPCVRYVYPGLPGFIPGLPPLPEFGGHDRGPFANLQLDKFYWTDVRIPTVSRAWSFRFEDGKQEDNSVQLGAYVWLVHDGDVAAAPAAPVPEPATWALLIAGFGAIGATLRGQRRRLRPA